MSYLTDLTERVSKILDAVIAYPVVTVLLILLMVAFLRFDTEAMLILIFTFSFIFIVGLLIGSYWQALGCLMIFSLIGILIRDD